MLHWPCTCCSGPCTSARLSPALAQGVEKRAAVFQYVWPVEPVVAAGCRSLTHRLLGPSVWLSASHHPAQAPLASAQSPAPPGRCLLLAGPSCPGFQKGSAKRLLHSHPSPSRSRLPGPSCASQHVLWLPDPVPAHVLWLPDPVPARVCHGPTACAP